MERLIKSLSDEVITTEEAVKRALGSCPKRRSADSMQAEADAMIGFAKVRAHLDELRARLGL